MIDEAVTAEINEMFSPRLTRLGLVAVLIPSHNVLAQSKEPAMARPLLTRLAGQHFSGAAVTLQER